MTTNSDINNTTNKNNIAHNQAIYHTIVTAMLFILCIGGIYLAYHLVTIPITLVGFAIIGTIPAAALLAAGGIVGGGIFFLMLLENIESLILKKYDS